MTHEDALNVILSHNCPNGTRDGDDFETWIFEGHCNTVTIRAKLVDSDVCAVRKEDMFKYEIVSIEIK